MPEPIVSLARLHKEADTAAKVAASSGRPQRNPYPRNSDAGAEWFRVYSRQLLVHSKQGAA